MSSSSSSLSPGKWAAFLAVNILVAAATALVFVRVLNQEPQRVVAQPAAAAAAARTAIPAFEPTAPAEAQANAPVDAQADAARGGSVPADPQATVTAATAQTAAQPAAPAQPAAAQAPAGEIKVRISAVRFPGQRTREAVTIVNEGDQVDLSGWSIVAADGQTAYAFKSFVLFRDSFITVYTAAGSDSPTSLFWNLDNAVWKRGDTVTLKQGDSAVSTYTVR